MTDPTNIVERVVICYADKQGTHHARLGLVVQAKTDEARDQVASGFMAWVLDGFWAPSLTDPTGWVLPLAKDADGIDIPDARLLIPFEPLLGDSAAINIGFLKGVRREDGTRLGDCSAIANLEALAAEICDV